MSEPTPITLVLTEADVRYRLITWNLTNWRPASKAEKSDTLWLECPEENVTYRDLGSLWDAFKPETMDVWRIKDKATGEMMMVAEIAWLSVDEVS